MNDNGVLLVPIIAAGSTDRKEFEYGVLNKFGGTASLVGAEVKNAGVPKSLGEFRVVADIGPPNCLKSIPYPADVSILRSGFIGPAAKALLW